MWEFVHQINLHGSCVEPWSSCSTCEAGESSTESKGRSYSGSKKKEQDITFLVGAALLKGCGCPFLGAIGSTLSEACPVTGTPSQQER